MSDTQVMLTSRAAPAVNNAFGWTVKDLSVNTMYSGGYARQLRFRRKKQCASFPLQNKSGCIALEDGASLCDTLVWNGSTWTIAQPCGGGGGAVTTVFPIVGDGTIPDPVQLTLAATSGSGAYFVPSAWNIYKNPGATTVTVGGAGAMYATVQQAFTSGSSFIRVISNTSETAWTLGGLTATQPILLYIDMGVTYTLTASVTLGNRNITVTGAGNASTFQWALPGGAPLFTANSGKLATFSNLTLTNSSGGSVSPIVDVITQITRINNAHVILGEFDTNFLGAAIGDAILDVGLQDVLVTTDTGGNVIIGNSASVVKINNITFDSDVTVIGVVMDVQSSQFEMYSFSRTNSTGGEIFNLQGIIDGFTDMNKNLLLNLGGSNTKFTNATFGNMTITGTDCFCSVIDANNVDIETTSSVFSDLRISGGLQVATETIARLNVITNCSVDGNFSVARTFTLTSDASGINVSNVYVGGTFSVCLVSAGGVSICNDSNFSNIGAADLIIAGITGGGGGSATMTNTSLANLETISSATFCTASTGSVSADQLLITGFSSNSAVTMFSTTGGSVTSQNSCCSNISIAVGALTIGRSTSGSTNLLNLELSNINCTQAITIFSASGTGSLNGNFSTISNLSSTSDMLIGITSAAGADVEMVGVVVTGLTTNSSVQVGFSTTGNVNMTNMSLVNFSVGADLSICQSTDGIITGDAVSIANVKCNNFFFLRAFGATGGVVSSSSSTLSGVIASTASNIIHTTQNGTVTANNCNLTTSNFNSLHMAIQAGNSITANQCKVSQTSMSADFLFAISSTVSPMSCLSAVFSDIQPMNFTFNSSTALGTVDTTGLKISNSTFAAAVIRDPAGTGAMIVDQTQVSNCSFSVTPSNFYGSSVLITNCLFTQDGHQLTILESNGVVTNTQVGVAGGGGGSLITFTALTNNGTAIGCYQNGVAFGGVGPARPIVALADVNFFGW